MRESVCAKAGTHARYAHACIGVCLCESKHAGMHAEETMERQHQRVDWP